MAQRQVATIPHVLENMVVAEEKAQIAPKLAAVKSDMRKLGGFSLSAAFGFEKAQTAKPTVQLRKERVHLQMALRGYPEVDFSFLAWRNKKTGFPSFMVLGLKSNIFRLFDETRWIGNELTGHRQLTTPRLPQAMERLYEESARHLHQIRHGWQHVQISAEFRGVMPDEVREKTRQASGDFDQIFLIAEAPAWKVDVVRPTKGDPLVIGWVQKTEQMFLITAFDPTELEQYVQTQHTF